MTPRLAKEVDGSLRIIYISRQLQVVPTAREASRYISTEIKHENSYNTTNVLLEMQKTTQQFRKYDRKSPISVLFTVA
jgi:hypothetical protein